MAFTHSLTEKKILKLKPRTKRYTVSDGYGLTLRVHPTGLKTWVLRLSFNGKTSDLHLGRYPEISLKHARQLARKKRKECELTPPKGYTFRDAFKLWANLKRGRIVSYVEERRRLERYLLPKLGNKQIDEITAPIVIQTVKQIEQKGYQATLKRVLMRTREILDLAVCAGFIASNPCARVSKVFAPPIVSPMPAVHWRELPEVFKTLNTAPEKIKLLFLWQLLTLLRPGESVKVKTEWIDNGILTIPACEMKKGRVHSVPLAPVALKVLEKAQSISPHPKSAFIWSGRKFGSHLNEQTLSKYLHKTPLKGRLVAHGLRSIGRSWLADNEYPFEPSEACLAHVVGSAVSRAYLRSDFLEQRKKLMADWCSFICECARRAEFLPEIVSTAKNPREKP